MWVSLVRPCVQKWTDPDSPHTFCKFCHPAMHVIASCSGCHTMQAAVQGWRGCSLLSGARNHLEADATLKQHPFCLYGHHGMHVLTNRNVCDTMQPGGSVRGGWSLPFVQYQMTTMILCQECRQGQPHQHVLLSSSNSFIEVFISCLNQTLRCNILCVANCFASTQPQLPKNSHINSNVFIL